jgi:hypothetical protein
MTRIKYKSKPTWHECGVIDRMTGRVFVVAESPASLLIRLKGTRMVLELPWGMAYLRAATLKASLLSIQKVNRRRAIKRGQQV